MSEPDIAAAEASVDAFVAEIHRRRPELTADPEPAGFCKGTAAALLFRGLELLAAARASQGEAVGPARELLLRTAVEVALRGRFLLGSDGLDELGRMLGYLLEKGSQKAKALGTYFGGASTPFLAAVPIPMTQPAATPGCCKPVPDPKPLPTRDLASIAQALDKAAGLTPEDAGSAVHAYRTFYGPLSDSAAHGGLAALRRFSELREGRVVIVENPEPLTHGPLHLTVTGYLGDLARAVFVAFEVPTDDLDATGVRWTSP